MLPNTGTAKNISGKKWKGGDENTDKQRVLFEAIILVLFMNSQANSQWESQESGVTVNLNDVSFVDSLHGWAVGDSATIIATNNGGKTWIRQNIPINAVNLNKVFFVNENVGYAIGDSGNIVATQNGGQLWEQSDSGVSTHFMLTDLSFINADTGWVTASDVYSNRTGLILHTTDGGRSWQKQLQTFNPNFFEAQLFSAVTFLNEKDGWAFASDFTDNFSSTNVYRTQDGGQQWEIIGEFYAPLREISIVSPDSIWAGGFLFAKSIDGGMTWEQINIKGENYSVSGVSDIHQFNAHVLLLVAGYTTPEQTSFSGVFLTEDGGKTWSLILEDQKPYLGAIASAGRNELWAVGSSGVILHYNKLTTSIDHSQDQIPKKFELQQNFPNPFNAGTSIRFVINERRYITLIIYDIKGREVAVLLSQQLSPGHYSFTWNGKDSATEKPAASGIYFYELRTLNLKTTKKMLLIR